MGFSEGCSVGISVGSSVVGLDVGGLDVGSLEDLDVGLLEDPDGLLEDSD